MRNLGGKKLQDWLGCIVEVLRVDWVGGMLLNTVKSFYGNDYVRAKRIW